MPVLSDEAQPGWLACSLRKHCATHGLTTGVVFCAQGEVIIYELPGMLVPATAQNLTGKRIARCDICTAAHV